MKMELYTDGACSGNPGPGGWGYVLLTTFHNLTEHIYMNYGSGDKATTNQKMELEACLKGLQFAVKNFQDDIEISIYTDSAYIVNCFKDKWYVKWQKNGWKNAKGQPVKNKEQWEMILKLLFDKKIKTFSFCKVAGHSGNKWNEEADILAKKGVTEGMVNSFTKS